MGKFNNILLPIKNIYNIFEKLKNKEENGTGMKLSPGFYKQNTNIANDKVDNQIVLLVKDIATKLTIHDDKDIMIFSNSRESKFDK